MEARRTRLKSDIVNVVKVQAPLARVLYWHNLRASRFTHCTAPPQEQLPDSGEEDGVAAAHDGEVNLMFQTVGAEAARAAVQRLGIVLSSCISPSEPLAAGVVKGYRKMIGGDGGPEGTFNYPWYVCVNRAGDLVVSDYGNHRIQVVRGDGSLVRTIGKCGTGPGEFRNPRGVSLTRKGEIIVTDSMNHRVQVLNSDGELVSVVGGPGSAPLQFRSPAGVCVDSCGRILIAEWDNHRVQILSEELEHVGFIGCSGSGEGEFRNPRGVAVDGADNILVTDTGNHRIQVFTPEGCYIFSIGCQKSSLPGQLADPWGIAVDGRGNILVSEWGNHRVQVLRGDGTFVKAIGKEGTGVNEFKGPLGFVPTLPNSTHQHLMPFSRRSWRLQLTLMGARRHFCRRCWQACHRRPLQSPYPRRGIHVRRGS